MRNPYFDKRIKKLTLRRLHRNYMRPLLVRDDIVYAIKLSSIESAKKMVESIALFSDVRNTYENYRRKVIELNSNNKEL